MKTNHYESVVILSASLEETQIDSVIKRIEDQVTSSGGQILNVDRLGRKRLAYQIQRSKSGYYIIHQFEAPRELISKLERNLRLDETVIRYLTIKLEKKDLEQISLLKAQKESAKVANAKVETEKVNDDSAESSDKKD